MSEKIEDISVGPATAESNVPTNDPTPTDVNQTPATALPSVPALRDIVKPWQREPGKPGRMSAWEKELKVAHGKTEDGVQNLIDRLVEAYARSGALHSDNVILRQRVTTLTGQVEALNADVAGYDDLRFAARRFVLVSGQITAITGLAPDDVDLFMGDENWAISWTVVDVDLTCNYRELTLTANGDRMTLLLSNEGLSGRQISTILPFFFTEPDDPEPSDPSETLLGATNSTSASGNTFSYLLEEYDCGNPDCPIHGTYGITTMLGGKSSAKSALMFGVLDTLLNKGRRDGRTDLNPGYPFGG